MIQVTPEITLDESEIQMYFIRSSGPGGQNVNKVATAVQLRFNVKNSLSLNEEVKRRLIALSRKRVNEEGVLVIDSRRFRSQIANREAAVERLIELIEEAAEKPAFRIKTRPTLASKNRRLETKRLHSKTKTLRRMKPDPSD
jgi:ribosome-associated protein